MYLAVRFASFSHVAAFTSGMLGVFETSMICEGRFILTDGILHFFVMLAMVIINYSESIPTNTLQYKKWLYISCIFVGLAFSVKYTALSLCFIIGFTQTCQLLIQHNFKFDENFTRELCIRAIQTFGTALSVHFFLWFIHFYLLRYIGPDTSNIFINSYHLINKTNYSSYNSVYPWEELDLSGSLWPPIIFRSFEAIFSSLIANSMNYKPHPYMSRPKDWPLLTDIWVSFWSEGNKRVICLGNVMNFYAAFFGVILLPFSRLSFLEHFKNQTEKHQNVKVDGFTIRKVKWIRAMRFVIGYWMSFLPFFGVPRTLFLYHYIIPLMFGICCFGISLDMFLPRKWSGFISVVVISLSAIIFFIFSPFVYASPLENIETRIFNPVWNHGANDRNEFYEKMQKKADEISMRLSSTQRFGDK